MVLLLQSWFVLTAGLLTVLALVVGVQALRRVARRPAPAAEPEPELQLPRPRSVSPDDARPGLQLLHS